MPSLFSKPNTIVYLRRNCVIVAGKQLKAARLNLSDNVTKNLEVTNQDKLLRGCKNFFSEQHVKGKRILLLLDQSLVYATSQPLTNKEDVTASVDAFVAAMPYAAGKRACVHIATANELQFYAANYEFYDTIVQALHAISGNKLLAVTPVAAYHLTTNEGLSTAIEQFVNDRSIWSTVNFAATRPL